MTPEERFSLRINEPDSYKCRECGHLMEFKGNDTYQCTSCEHEYISEYGRIRRYLKEHGGCSMMELAQNTGIKLRRIQAFINEGHLSATQSNNNLFR